MDVEVSVSCMAMEQNVKVRLLLFLLLWLRLLEVLLGDDAAGVHVAVGVRLELVRRSRRHRRKVMQRVAVHVSLVLQLPEVYCAGRRPAAVTMSVIIVSERSTIVVVGVADIDGSAECANNTDIADFVEWRGVHTCTWAGGAENSTSDKTCLRNQAKARFATNGEGKRVRAVFDQRVKTYWW